MAINGGRIISYLELDTSKYNQGFKQATDRMLGFQSLSGDIGAKAGVAAKIMTIGVTAPYIAGAAMATKQAIAFESAFAGVKKTVDASAEGYERLKESIMELAKVTPATHAELAGIMESGGQLGVAEKDLKKFTKTIADLGVATNLTNEAGASMIAQYANVKKMSLDDVDRFGSVIVELGNNTATTELDIMSMAQRLSGAANVVKLTDSQTLALSATMTSLGINAEAGGSAMSRTLAKINKSVASGGETLDKFAETAGMTGEEFKTLFNQDALKALDAFLQGIAKIQNEGGNIYSALEDVGLNDLRVTDVITRMTGAQGALAKNTALANKAWKENNALKKEAEQRYSTTESKIKLSKNTINESLIKTGEAFLPVVAGIASAVSKAADSFSKLDDNTRGTIVKIGGIMAAAGPVVGIITKMVALLGGPGGLIALGGVAGIALYKSLLDKKAHDELEKLRDSLGGVKLDSEDIKKIFEAGFPAPIVDVSGLKVAQEASSSTIETFKTLYSELQKGVYNMRFNIETPETLAQKAASVIDSAQDMLSKQGSVFSVGITAHFRDDPEKAAQLGQIIDSWVTNNSEQIKRAGKNLTKTIFDNTLTGADKEAAIRKGIADMNEIIVGIMETEKEADMQAFLGKWKNSGLDAESFKAFKSEIQALIENEKKNIDEAYKVTLRGLAAAKRTGALTESEYQREIQAANEQYAQNITLADLGEVKFGYDALARDKIEKMNKAIELVKNHRSRLENDIDYRDYGNNGERTDVENEIQSLIDSANAGWEYLAPFYEKLEKMRESGVQLTGEMADIFDNLGKLKNVKELNNPLADYIDSSTEKEKEKGKSSAEAYVQGQKDTMSEKQGEIKGAFSLPDMTADAITNATHAAYGFINKLTALKSEARRAGSAFGASALIGMKTKLEIFSPSRATKRLAMQTADGYIFQMKNDEKRAFVSGSKFGNKVLDGTADSFKKGSQKAMDSFDLKYNPQSFRRAGGGLPKLNAEARALLRQQNNYSNKKKRSGAGSGVGVRAQVEEIAEAMNFTLPSRDELSRLDSLREKLLSLSGSHRAYYDDKKIDLELKATTEKWQKLIEKEEEGFKALSDKQQEASLENFNKHMSDLRKMQSDEISAIKRNYDTQKRIALDFLQARADELNKSFSEKQEQAQREDAEKEKAELEKRIRQSRSARERRELSEELARIKRDEALEKERKSLQMHLNGINAIKNAVNEGVVGLGALLPGSDLYTGSGLKTIQGATSENIALALKAVSESASKSASQAAGNHYTIDLSGAVIRDDSDITRIVDEFDRISRSQGRGF